MKKLLLIALCFVLVGCQGGVNNPGETNFDDLGVEKSFDNEGEGRELIDTEEDNLTLMEKYAKWSLDLESDNGQLVVSQLQEDCFVSDFWNPKGDLLSTIVANNSYFQDNYDVNVYRDIDYLIELDKKVIDAFSERNWSNFNMHLVCNLSNNVELLAGMNGHDDSGVPGMYLVNNGEVIEVADSKYVLGSAKHGPSICSISSVESESFVWDCDGGFLYDGEVVVGTKYDRYEISFDGEVLSEESIEEIR